MGAAKLRGHSRSRAYSSRRVRDIASGRVFSGGGQLKLPLSPVYVWEVWQFGPAITVRHVLVAEEDNWVRAVVVRLSEYVAVGGKHFYRLIATHRTAHDPGPHLSGLRPGYNPFILGPH